MRPLFINQQFGITNDVDEQDMANLKLNRFFNLAGHPVKLRENKAIDNARLLPTVEVKIGRLSNPASLRPCTSNAL